ncbi:hypothetical protein HMPREF3208_00529 [Gardnerella vaginalis]|uniref:Uncharacterized protein n=1 Tax=Gardnerella vaginalis TaxID=2702 RepID=A0A133NZA1_GARVA|nr:hypothetical protein HMPREF3208_00529 [Gardnerella vaginalis]
MLQYCEKSNKYVTAEQTIKFNAIRCSIPLAQRSKTAENINCKS